MNNWIMRGQDVLGLGTFICSAVFGLLCLLLATCCATPRAEDHPRCCSSPSALNVHRSQHFQLCGTGLCVTTVGEKAAAPLNAGAGLPTTLESVIGMTSFHCHIQGGDSLTDTDKFILLYLVAKVLHEYIQALTSDRRSNCVYLIPFCPQ